MFNQAEILTGGVDRLVELRARLETVWSADTSASPDRWTPQRSSLGQCAITALLVQDLFGGVLLRSVNEGDSHYWNRLDDGAEVDLTRDQFETWAPTEEVVVRERSYLEGSELTMGRYATLVGRLLTPA